MKIIKPSVDFWGQVPTDYEGNLGLIERAGRGCYKSEDKIGCMIRDPQEFAPDYCAEEGRWDDVNGGVCNCGAGCKYHSAGKFVDKLTKAVHWAMLEHSNHVLRCRDRDFAHLQDFGRYLNKFKDKKGEYFVGGNLRAWMEWLPAKSPWEVYELTCNYLWAICPHEEIPPELHRYTIKFTCDRGVSHELVRHRPCSFAQESTRYVNYGGLDMEFIEPAGFDEWTPDQKYGLKDSCGRAEANYNFMLRKGLKPQQARAVLPNALKTEIVVTADAAEWKIIKGLRLHKAAHTDMQRVMAMVPWEEMGL